MTQKIAPITVELTFGNFTTDIEFLVIDEVSTILIGCPFMRENLISIRFEGNNTVLDIGENGELGRVPCLKSDELLVYPVNFTILTPGFNKVRMYTWAPHLSLMDLELVNPNMPIKLVSQLVQMNQDSVEIDIFNFAKHDLPLSSEVSVFKATLLSENDVLTGDEFLMTDDFGVPVKIYHISNQTEPNRPNREPLITKKMKNDFTKITSSNLNARKTRSRKNSFAKTNNKSSSNCKQNSKKSDSKSINFSPPVGINIIKDENSKLDNKISDFSKNTDSSQNHDFIDHQNHEMDISENIHDFKDFKNHKSINNDDFKDSNKTPQNENLVENEDLNESFIDKFIGRKNSVTESTKNHSLSEADDFQAINSSHKKLGSNPVLRDENSEIYINEEDLEPRGFDIDLNRLEAKPDIWKEDLKRSNFPRELLDAFIERLDIIGYKVFATHPFDVGVVPEELACVWDLDMKPGSRLKNIAIKHNWIRRQQIQLILDQLVLHGFIEIGSSRFGGSPVFLVKKKNNELRLVTCFQELNSLTRKHFYQIQDIKDIFQQMSEVNGGNIYYFTTIDLSNAYASIQVKGIAREQMSLITQDSQFLINKLLFGTQGAPSIFNETIQKVLSKIQPSNAKFCFAYFDDITIVTGEDKMDHMEKVLKVLKALGENGFKIRADKCSYFQQSVELLGSQVTRHGIKPSRKHIEAIQRLKPATNVNEVQKLMGILVWHSHLLYNFSKYASALTKLLRSHTVFHWGPEQQEALDHFKREITERLMVYFPDFSKPVYLATDASVSGIGSCCYQVRTFKRDIKELSKHLLLDEIDPKYEIDNKKPVLPKSGSNCPKAFSLHQGDIELLADHLQYANLELNEKATEDEVHLCVPVGYFSKAVTPTQAKYIPMELEAMALVLSIKHFAPLLACFPERYILTDSQPILYLTRKALIEGTPKMARWIMVIKSLPIDMYLLHTRGDQNIIADLLSRSVCVAKLDQLPKNEIEFKGEKLKRGVNVAIFSPFRTGQTVTIEDIIRAIEVDPGLVYNIVDNGVPMPKRDVSINSVIFQFFSNHQRDVSLNSLSLGSLGSPMPHLLNKDLQLGNIITRQKEDEKCQKIMEKLDSMNNFYIFQGVLYKKRDLSDSAAQPGRIVIPVALLPSLITYYHLANHCGAKTLFDQIRPNYYHKSLFEVVTHFTQSCYLCLVYRNHKTTQPIAKRLPPKKWATWSFDVMGSLPRTTGGHKYILSCIEHYHQWVIIEALRTDTSSEIAKCITNRVLTAYPLAETLLCDNARNLGRSRRLQAICYHFGVKVHCISSYSSKTNGLCENLNRKVSDLLRIFNNTMEFDWDILLPSIQMALNTKPLSALDGLSPEKAAFNFEGRVVAIQRAELEAHHASPSEFRQEWGKHQQKVDKILEKWTEFRNKQNAKKTHNAPKNFEIGDFILLKDKSPRVQKKSKHIFYPTPLKIISNKTSTVLAKDYQGRIRLIHKDNVIPCKTLYQEYFDKLPHEFKLKLNLFYTIKDLEEFFEDPSSKPHLNREIFKNPLPSPLEFPDPLPGYSPFNYYDKNDPNNRDFEPRNTQLEFDLDNLRINDTESDIPKSYSDDPKTYLNEVLSQEDQNFQQENEIDADLPNQFYPFRLGQEDFEEADIELREAFSIPGGKEEPLQLEPETQDLQSSTLQNQTLENQDQPTLESKSNHNYNLRSRKKTSNDKSPLKSILKNPTQISKPKPILKSNYNLRPRSNGKAVAFQK